jgi:outer membrane biosynthesis protein TonB
MRHCVAAAVVAAGVAMPGCGSAGAERGLAPLERSRLTSQLAAVRDAAGRRDRSAAKQALDDFASEVTRLARVGALDSTTARALLVGVAQARRRVAIELAPPPPPQPVQPAPAPERHRAKPKPPKQEAPKEEAPKEEEKNGKGHGKGGKDGKGD